jgi:hypothetical protein
MNNELIADAYTGALCLYAFAREYPEAEEAARRFYGNGILKNVIQAGETFNVTRDPAPLADAIREALSKLMHFAAPDGNWN